MNDKLKYSLIVSLYLIVTIGLLVGTFFILKPIRTSNLSKEILKKYETVADGVVRVEEVDFEKGIITEKYDGFDEDNRKVATLYTATNSNTYGSITIVVALSPEGDIIGIDAANVGQTLLVQEIRASINEFNNNISDTYDGVAGATRAKETINEILSTIRLSHGDGEVPIEPVEPEEGIEFIEYVIEDNNLKGATYQVTKDSPNTEPGGATERLSFKFTIDLDYKITAFEEVWYKHTAGGFKVQTIAFLESIVGKTINEVSNITLVDGETGATNSKNGVIGLIEELEIYLEDNPLTLDPIVKEVEENIYNVKKLAFYFRNYGYLSYNVTLNETGEIVSYDEVSYGHSEGNWKDIATAYFDSLVGKNIDDINHDLTDGQTGATNSSKTIRDMLIALAEFIKEGE